jgi:P4 family phage/plasmid primase-like protien
LISSRSTSFKEEAIGRLRLEKLRSVLNRSRQVNPEIGLTFLSQLFAGAEGRIEVRPILPGNVVPSDLRVFASNKAELARGLDAIKAAKVPANVYFGCATRIELEQDGKPTLLGDKQHTNAIPAIFTELDFKDHGTGGSEEEIRRTGRQRAEDIIANFPLRPSIEILSGGGLHVYWLLHKPVDAHHPRIEPILRGLGKALQADPSAAEIARVLRVPGTFNYKYDLRSEEEKTRNGSEPRHPIVTIRRQDWNLRYTLPDFDQYAVETHKPLANNPSSPAVPPGERYPVKEMIDTMMRDCVAGNRDNTVYKCFAQLCNNVYTEQEAAAFDDYVFRLVPSHPDPNNRFTVADVRRCRRSAYKSGPRGEPWKLPKSLRKQANAAPINKISMKSNGQAPNGQQPKDGFTKQERAPDVTTATEVTGSEPIANDKHARDSGSVGPDLLSPQFYPEDVGNAQRLIALHGQDMRYCHEFKKWLVWNGRTWERDTEGQALAMAKDAMKKFAVQAMTEFTNLEEPSSADRARLRFATSSLKENRLLSLLHLAQPELHILTRDMDTDPHLINFRNGTVDLRTGELIPHRREHYITKQLRYNYTPQAQCPMFLSFLRQITAAHPEFLNHLQRAFGYSLTGITIEKTLFLLHGPGDNGKSTLLATFLALLGDYAVLLQIDTLMVHKFESNNTNADLAELRGARFVMTSETEKNQRLAEAKIKRVTQGMGEISATRKYENPIRFKESHKLWIDANHLPTVRGTDNAIWNRLQPIPFDTVITKDAQDKDLPAKLLTEAEGILAWTVAGAKLWYESGLQKPAAVEKARDEWRTESNQIARFVDARCEFDPTNKTVVGSTDLYKAYKLWCVETGEKYTESQKSFAVSLADNGIVSKHTKNGNVYPGLVLNTSSGEAFTNHPSPSGEASFTDVSDSIDTC